MLGICDREKSLEKWAGYYLNYKEVDGIKIPMELEAVWHLKSGELPYARFKVEEVEWETRG